MNYIEELKKLVCSQVDEFIIDVMRPEKDADYQTRRSELGGIDDVYEKKSNGTYIHVKAGSLGVDPLYTTLETNDGNTSLITQYKKSENGQYELDKDGNRIVISKINNNPLFPENLIAKLNTPFDHIDRIFLQDFSMATIGSGVSITNLGIDSYIKQLFLSSDSTDKIIISPDSVKRIGAEDKQYNIDFSAINDNIKLRNQNFFIDSFTYTPFIDYSTTDSQVGIYQDEYLAKYNTGWYDDKTRFVDVNRRNISSNLYELCNLDRILNNAKIQFRNAIDTADWKTYIYTFCDHIVDLFAKLSNIRMSHLIYGLKTPHTQWEGIIALDVWYNLLYKNIDSHYSDDDMFNDTYIGRSPVSKLKIVSDNNKKYVEYYGKKIYQGTKSSTNNDWYSCKLENGNPDPNYTWMTNGVEDGYVLLWDSNLYAKFTQNANNINERRNEYVLPRGVLKKIRELINNGVPTRVETVQINGRNQSLTQFIPSLPIDTLPKLTGSDFSWFYQKGKVYSDTNKSVFTKYTNLHLGRAYDVMTPVEYYALVNIKAPINGKYVKPTMEELTSSGLSTIRYQMVRFGCLALEDAFSVIKNEKLFNIFNSRTNKIEEFNPQNANDYTQSQCAIVIERIFSRLYKYLSFKSTTTEVFSRHVNIDSGYKYLTTESLTKSDNKKAGIYYDDQSTTTKYFSYLNKLKRDYIDSDSKVLSADEREILGKAVLMLSKNPYEWITEGWNLCPECLTEKVKRDAMLIKPKIRAISPDEYAINIHMGLSPLFNLYSSGKTVIPSNFTKDDDVNTQILTYVYQEKFDMELSQLELHPQYTWISKDGKTSRTLKYELVGYSTSPEAKNIEFMVDSIVPETMFDSGNVVDLYAVWKKQYILVFNQGYRDDVVGEMQPLVVDSGTQVTIPKCQYELIDTQNVKKFNYYANSLWKPIDEKLVANESIKVWGFDSWRYTFDGSTTQIKDNSVIFIPENTNAVSPVITFVANWDRKYNAIQYRINGEPYCDVFVPTTSNTIYSVVDPELTTEDMRFIGWNTIIGSSFESVNIDNVVCETDSNGDNILICEQNGSDDIIVCQDNDSTKYHAYIDAQITKVFKRNFGITFRFLAEEDGEVKPIERHANVVEGSTIPLFHIHDDVVFNGNRMVFRYWKVESGNLSASMAILSNIVLVAVYDEIAKPMEQVETIDNDKITIIEPIVQTNPEVVKCPYVSEGLNKDGEHYCTFIGDFPVDKDNLDQNGNPKMVHINCPIVNMMKMNYHAKNDFAPLTIIEISDVANLIKALFKVNIDIAHREYYLRVDIQSDMDWWYGYVRNGMEIICLPEETDIICDDDSESIVCEKTSLLYDSELVCSTNESCEIVCEGDTRQVICKSPSQLGNTEIVCSPATNGDIVCGNNSSDSQIVCATETSWISFEPTVEYKFSNLHALNQVEAGKLLCTVSSNHQNEKIIPINRELLTDSNGIHYSDYLYCYDYANSLNSIKITGSVERKNMIDIMQYLNDNKGYYSIEPLCLYENSTMQSPTDVNGFVKHRLSEIERTSTQVQTYTSIVKKYRPIIVPNVRDIFNDCVNNSTKYEVDIDNTYGVFGWCTIPSKTMVNMEYNEHSIIVPSSYDHHNRVGGSNFLQMDSDLPNIYRTCNDSKTIVSTIQNSWFYLYNTRDWTYFMKPFFNMSQNITIWSEMLDLFPSGQEPKTSNHINGVIFEPTVLGRSIDVDFGNIVDTCRFIAQRHHNVRNLEILSEDYTNLLSFAKLKELTSGEGDINSVYGSKYDVQESYRYSSEQWIDDFNKTGAYIGDEKYDNVYKYNLGQSHAIDDFDEDSVWMYITMTPPLEEQEQVVELEDIMPFVFWWSNRGTENNGIDVDCYGLYGSAKKNYEQGGWCYESSMQNTSTNKYGNIVKDAKGNAILDAEQRWHSVQHTLGVDFSKTENGGSIVTYDNTGNCYKGAFDPMCTGTDEKWKIHSEDAFGSYQHEDILEDKYYIGTQTHGNVPSPSKIDVMRNDEMTLINSIKDKPMTWNLWNVVRHYAYIKYFKSQQRVLGDNQQAWDELETRTRKLMKGIYRTFKQNQYKNSEARTGRQTFYDVDNGITNYGENCLLRWCNSFVEIQSIFERNARQHDASFVLFLGNDSEFSKTGTQIEKFTWIKQHKDNFLVTTFDGPDDDATGMRERIREGAGLTSWKSMDGVTSKDKIFQGTVFQDLPTSYGVGDSLIYASSLPDVVIQHSPVLSIDQEYPSAEYYKGDTTRKWDMQIYRSYLTKQLFPIYTSMENMTVNHHKITVSELKSITFQIIPQFYWKYQWSFNEFMIHRVGKLAAPCSDLPMYDMLGNVWEWVRDDYLGVVGGKDKLVGGVNPIAGSVNGSTTKVIRGGAFDQLCRKTISSSREGLNINKCQSEFGTQANVGFRPVLTYTSEITPGGFTKGNSPVDLFFLFDASASQDSEIDKMIASSMEIIKQFASDDDPDKCHVGSALFMGPQIHMMMGQKKKTISEYWYNVWSEDSYDWKMGKGKDSRNYKYTAYYRLQGQTVQGGGYQDDTLTLAQVTDSFVNRLSEYRNISKTKAKNLIDNTTTKNAFQNLKAQFIKLKESQNSYARGIDSEDDELCTMPNIIEDEFDDVDIEIEMGDTVSFQSLDAEQMTMRGDTGSVNGHTNTTSGEYHAWHITQRYRKFYAYEYIIKGSVWSGSPAIKDGDEIKFLTTSNQKQDSSYFYTYKTNNPQFINPFVRNPDRGTLSNWFSGCEPVCDMTSKLIGDGWFESPIGTEAIGYMFRPGVPKLVFVFSNEFDNQFTRTYTKSDGSTQTGTALFPHAYGNKNKTTDNTNVGFTAVDSEQVNFKNRTTKSANAIDQFCLTTLADVTSSQLEEFLNSVMGDFSFSSVDTMKSAVSNLKNTLPDDSKGDKNVLSRYFLHSIPQMYFNGRNLNSTIMQYPYLENMNYNINHTRCYPDVNYNAYTISKSIYSNIDPYLLDLFKNAKTATQDIGDLSSIYKGHFNEKQGTYIPDGIKSQYVRTVGSMYLQQTLSKMNESTNVYVMVTDANAPKPISQIFDGDTLERKVKKLFLLNNEDFFADIRDVKLPEHISKIITSLWESSVTDKNGGNKKTVNSFIKNNSKEINAWGCTEPSYLYPGSRVQPVWTWRTLFLTNVNFWKHHIRTSGKGSKDALRCFGDAYSLTTSSHIVHVTRDHAADLAKYINREKPYNNAGTGTSRFHPLLLSGYNKYTDAINELNVWTQKIIGSGTYDSVKKICDALRGDGADSIAKAPAEVKAWFNKHLFIPTGTNDASDRNRCQAMVVKLDNDTAVLYQVKWDTSKNKWEKDTGYQFEKLHTSTSFKAGSSTDNRPPSVSSDNPNVYTLSGYQTAFDCTTLTYKDSSGNKTGELSVISCNKWSETPLGDKTYSIDDELQELLLRKTQDSVPQYWSNCMVKLANDWSWPSNVDPGENIWKLFAKKVWENETIVNYVQGMYKYIQSAFPALMAYRYYLLFKQMKSGSNKFVTDYSDSDANVIVKPLPISDIGEMADIFQKSFGDGQFNDETKFQYNYAVVDLNPNKEEYDTGLQDGKFPVTLIDTIDNINVDEYKTSKMVLTRPPDICGSGAFDQQANRTTGEVTFTMGSSSTDYNVVTDARKLLYKDDEAIVTGAQNNNVSVTLKNGGSYQKNDQFYGIDTNKDGKIEVTNKDGTPSDSVALIDYVWNTNAFEKPPSAKQINNKYALQTKYYRNKQLFIDPFAVTISQWCYVHAWKTKASARNALKTLGQLDEIEKSYWKYLQTWERSEWSSLMVANSQNGTLTAQQVMDGLISSATYNPLEDTRPYYYATYQNVRGTTTLYSANTASRASSYMLTANGDEFQMNSRINQQNATSFMDILNKNATMYTMSRVYRTENGSAVNNANASAPTPPTSLPTGNDGGRYLNKAQMYTNLYNEYNKLSEAQKAEWTPNIWCCGESAGLNFDLPTEAQWEYFCRLSKPGTLNPIVPSSTAIPRDYNLGDIYEEKDTQLDLIAWYKYKVIGSLPEPERFCSWRVSKLVFGISRDDELVNNVYEYTNW